MDASMTQLVGGLFWPPDATTQAAILLLLGVALIAIVTIYLPLFLRLVRIAQLQRSVEACFDEESSNAIQRQEVATAFTESPLAFHWTEFVRRWQNAIAADPIQDASLPELSRAPVRLAEIFEEHPIIEVGARRSLLPTLPAVFLAAGLLGAFAGLVLALPGIALSLDPASFEGASRSQQLVTLMEHLGMALRIGLWGLLLSLAAAIGGRVIEGRSEILGQTLDSWVQLAYGSISSGELATRTAHEQRAAIARLQDEVTELSRQVSARPRPLIRSTASVPGAVAASGDPEASIRAIEALGADLSREISHKLDRTLTEQLGALRESLAAATRGTEADRSFQDVVEQLMQSSENQDAASRSLTQTASSVADAAEELRSGLDDFADAVSQMRETGASLALTSQRVDAAQVTASRASESLAASLERSESSAVEQRERLEAGFDALQSGLTSLSQTLEIALSRAAGTAAESSGDTPVATLERGLAALAEQLDAVSEGLEQVLAAGTGEGAPGRSPSLDTSELEAGIASLAAQLDAVVAGVRSSSEEQRGALAASLREELDQRLSDAGTAPDPDALEAALVGRLDAALADLRSTTQGHLTTLSSSLRSDLAAQLREATGKLEASLAELASAPARAIATPSWERDTAVDERAPIVPSPDDTAAAASPESPSPSSEADTLIIRAPTEREYAAEEPARDAPPTRSRSESSGRGEDRDATLSGLLRVTHHSGPSAPDGHEPLPIDPEDRLDPDAPTAPIDTTALRDGDDESEERSGDDSPRRRGLFGRRR